MKEEIKQPVRQDIHTSNRGSSFHGITIMATPNQLIKALGEPEYFPNDGSDKTNMDYECVTDNGVEFTIYDWKEYRPLEMDSNYSFHIGGYDRSECAVAFIKLMKML